MVRAGTGSGIGGHATHMEADQWLAGLSEELGAALERILTGF
jgi:hypothetical protein